ncbi:hypothetical protein C0Q70_14729 [Pomacea canaliculata]|uniref:Uncharacterized protein n=1 Tax=Pomacea canaliculata TaxID=400727 RepID=A0A2T7NSX7_POMCA|nr:hypothetical protein C0Q70_14729 [Pomacea canaliculata]
MGTGRFDKNPKGCDSVNCDTDTRNNRRPRAIPLFDTDTMSSHMTRERDGGREKGLISLVDEKSRNAAGMSRGARVALPPGDSSSELHPSECKRDGRGQGSSCHDGYTANSR